MSSPDVAKDSNKNILTVDVSDTESELCPDRDFNRNESKEESRNFYYIGYHLIE